MYWGPFLGVSYKEINGKDSLTYEEEPVDILDCQVRKLGSKEITLVKVLWKNQKVEEATWESENDMRARYPSIFETVDDDMEGTNLILLVSFHVVYEIMLIVFLVIIWE